MSKSYLFTSESVGEGHPDKMADQVSDAILDAILAQEPRSRVACETMTKTGMVIVAGEITTNAVIEVEHIVRQVVLDIGYDHSDKGFDGNTCAVLNALGKQSQDIAQGVDRKCARRAGRRRPRPHVRLCDERDRQLHAGSDHLLASLGREAGRSAQERQAAVAAPGREEPVHVPLRERQARRHRRGRALDAAQPGYLPEGPARGRHGRDHQARVAGEVARQEDAVPHQPDRPVRDRRSDGRLRSHGPQDHRRHATAVSLATAAARSRARILRRSTARLRTPRATSRRTSLRPVSRIVARFRCRTRSALRSRRP